MARFLDVARFTPTAGGTTDWTVSAAVQGYQTPVAAGAIDGQIYRYRAESADLSQWEIGYGAASSSGTVFARTTVLFNSSGTTSKISFTAAPTVGIVPLGEDFREKLDANRTYYVATTGSDTLNNGLSVGSPFLTITKAYSVILMLDLNGYTATIQLATGTYGGFSQTASPVGGNIAITGDTVTPSNVVISESTQPALGFISPVNVTLSGVTLQTTGSSNNRGISAAGAGVNIYIGPSMVFGACSGSQIFCNRNALVSLDNGYTINGGGPRHYLASQGGVISGTGQFITVTGTPAFSSAFAEATLAGVLQATGMTYSGAATGSRYNAASGGLINRGGGGGTYFPGNAAGTGTNYSASPWGLYV